MIMQKVLYISIENVLDLLTYIDKLQINLLDLLNLLFWLFHRNFVPWWYLFFLMYQLTL